MIILRVVEKVCSFVFLERKSLLQSLFRLFQSLFNVSDLDLYKSSANWYNQLGLALSLHHLIAHSI